jgi:hypothetical protein
VFPTYSIGTASGTTKQMILTLTVAASSTLTDSGEPIALFAWDGSSDLVQDVDLLVACMPLTNNAWQSKSGATQGASAYAMDADTIAAGQAACPTGAAESTKRIAPEDGAETQDGTGNGINGDDETSEDVTMTWDTSPFMPPTPGTADF